jgi:tRNA A37 threonylcarbamoyladenosine dehydratase
MDGDTVSPTNCVRQPFGAADIGQNKATSLVNRVNLFHGIRWSSEVAYFSKDRRNDQSSYDSTIDFVISCVDTRAARREMHEAFNSKSGPWRMVRYWLLY